MYKNKAKISYHHTNNAAYSFGVKNSALDMLLTMRYTFHHHHHHHHRHHHQHDQLLYLEFISSTEVLVSPAVRSEHAQYLVVCEGTEQAIQQHLETDRCRLGVVQYQTSDVHHVRDAHLVYLTCR